MTADAIVAEQVVLTLHRTKTTKRALAEVLGISEQSVGKKINGYSTFSLDELLLLAKHFDVQITDLLPGPDYEPITGQGRRGGTRRAWRDSNPQPSDREPAPVLTLVRPAPVTNLRPTHAAPVSKPARRHLAAVDELAS